MGTPHKIFQLQMWSPEWPNKDGTKGNWWNVTGLQGSFTYCLGGLHMGDSFNPAPKYRIINVATGEVKEETNGRGPVQVN